MNQLELFFDIEKFKDIPKRDDLTNELPSEWSDLMKGFIPAPIDRTTTGTFDTGGPSLDNKQWESKKYA